MLLAIDKPHGWTSYDCIRYIKKHFPKQKIGHAGTLDPYASGLLIVATEADTKTLSQRLGQDKVYEAKIDFSQKSDTRDLQFWEDHTCYICNQQGLSIEGIYHQAPSLSQLHDTLRSLIPEYQMPVPPFSAKKIQGLHSYDLARSGNLIIQYRTMKFHDYQIVSYEFPILHILVTVGSGTYIRSLAYWLGMQYGLGGILVGLRRISIGNVGLPTHNTHGDDKISIGKIS